ncbi:Hypothetical protein R9X50_00170100 [Acrodontium crateriforme]|uniref:GYF domain-containing protein n=1 Tax=Acrodontium crateriforme TaxID=150365 RepID=A0AAQ3LZG3_9PEZI|nr:Hypothetical protein R9X50_00170100 [Acrodontium crateriforme]
MAARPKRGAEDYMRSHEGSSKKIKFDARNPSKLAADAPEEDLILDADVIGKSGLQTKRNAVNIDGYESDSDNDKFDARAAERERMKKAEMTKDDEDDDMFADLEERDPDGDDDEDLGEGSKRKKKDVRFLDSADIEGQVMNSKSGGHISNDILLNPRDKRPRSNSQSSSSSGSDSERDAPPDEMEEELAAEIGAGGKKRHAPRLDAFNLKGEEEEGRYDESGNYVRKAADPDAVNDTWLDGLSKKDMKRAKEAQAKREEERREKAARDDATLTSDVLATLIQHLDTGETPLEALARLNKAKPKETKVPKWKKKKQKDNMDVDEPSTNGSTSIDSAETTRRKAVEAITGAADALYSREQHEIYETERELLMRQYKRETGEDWKPASTTSESDVVDVMWEYRWSDPDAPDGGQIHGPYDAPTMKAWREAGYFGQGVEFRRTNGGDWDRLLSV